MKTYIITGATRGLGLAIAKCLALDPSNRVVLAVRNSELGQRLATSIGPNVEVVALNLRSPSSIDAFIAEWQGDIAGLINNAGVQIVNETRFTEQEKFEETFAVNHLAALRLTHGLLPALKGGRVLFIGSGTHNPNNKVAKLFGFRGAKLESIKDCAEGLNSHGSIKQMGMDRYATSKFLNMVTAVELSRRAPSADIAFFCLDPGLMAGTGLARTAPALLQFLWANILPIVAKLLPDTSTPERSGAAAAWIMTSSELEGKTGIIFSYNRKPSNGVWSRVFDAEVGNSVIQDSMDLLAKRHLAPQALT